MHGGNWDNLACFASSPQALIEVLEDTFLSNHGQRRHVPYMAHGGPTAPDRPLAAFVATVPRPRCELHQRS